MAAIIVSMSNLTKKGAIFKWGASQQAVLQKLLTLIMRRIKIYEPSSHQQLVVMPDACNVGVGATEFAQIQPAGTEVWDKEQTCIAECVRYREALGLRPSKQHPQTPRLDISEQ